MHHARERRRVRGMEHACLNPRIMRVSGWMGCVVLPGMGRSELPPANTRHPPTHAQVLCPRMGSPLVLWDR